MNRTNSLSNIQTNGKQTDRNPGRQEDVYYVVNRSRGIDGNEFLSHSITELFTSISPCLQSALEYSNQYPVTV